MTIKNTSKKIKYIYLDYISIFSENSVILIVNGLKVGRERNMLCQYRGQGVYY